MVGFRCGLVGSLSFVWLGCGPNVSEVRTVSYPARESTCTLEFLKLDMADYSSSSGTWEMIGQVVLSQEGDREPLDEEYKAIVRPRACRMGGEGVTVVLNANSQTATSSGTTISYGVLRKRRNEPEKPAKF